MNRSASFILPGLIVLMALPGHLVHANTGVDCVPSLETPHQSVRIAYDPFDATPASATLRFHVRNTGADACDAMVALFRDGSPQARSPEQTGGLDYVITGQNGEMLVSGMAAPPEQLHGRTLQATRLAPGATAEIAAVISIPRGQTLPPGDYEDVLAAGIYMRDGQQFRKAAAHGTATVRIAAMPVMRLALAGGGLKTTLDFGELVKGAARAVNLVAYTNQGFRLRIESEQGGVMRPVDPVAQAEGNWRVPYTVSVNRAGHAPVETGRSVMISGAATGLAGLHIPIEVRTGDPSGQRAGVYRDVLTVSVEPPS